MVTNRMQLLTCDDYGCPGCDYRHFLRTSDDVRLTEVPDEGLFTVEQLRVLGEVALSTGAVTAPR